MEKVCVSYLTLFIRPPLWQTVPVLHNGKVFSVNILFFSAKVKSVGKNLIHNSAHRPLWSFKAFFVAGNLPSPAGIFGNTGLCVNICGNNISVTVLGAKSETMPVKSDPVRNKVTFPFVVIIIVNSKPVHLMIFPVVVLVKLYA